MEDLYKIVTWPDSQKLREKEGVAENAYLINDGYGIEKFGTCAYFVNVKWLEENDKI